MAKKTRALGAAEGGFRQAHAWLHTWCGLWFCWLLFAVCFTGSLAVFEEAITHWMMPEHHALEAAEAAAPLKPGAPLAQRLDWGVDYMRTQHPGASMWELWPADAQGAGPLRVYWFDRLREYASAELDPASGAPLQPAAQVAQRQTLGGHHFVDFHYQLHAGQIGLWIVGAAALAMLVALVSGVITHRRIFQDFFTFRARKGQRSWLDAHNAVAVLTLPFQLMIAYTGIVISALTFVPAGALLQFGTGDAGAMALQAALNEPGKPEASGQPMAVPPLAPFVLRGEQLMGQRVRAVVIDHPGDAAARIGVYGWNEDAGAPQRLSPTSGLAMFSAATGDVLQVRLPGDVDGGRASLAQSVLAGLHMVAFGGFALKWLYFVCGLAGSAMVATGALLFVVKRRARHAQEFGAHSAHVYRGIEAANVAAIAGLGLACIGFLWANRLLPPGLAQRAQWELSVFFALWALALGHAFVRPAAAAWKEQLGLLAALCLLLPLLNALSVGDHLLAQMWHGDWESAGVELFVLASGVAAAWTVRFLSRKRTAALPVRRNVPPVADSQVLP